MRKLQFVNDFFLKDDVRVTIGVKIHTKYLGFSANKMHY